MKQFVSFLMILFLAVSGYHFSFRSLKMPLFARKFYLTGIEYLFIGMLLGPEFFNIIDENTYSGLAPLSGFALGWIGLLFGFQFEIKKLQRYPLELFVAAFTQSAVTLVFVFCASFGVLTLYFNLAAITAMVYAFVLSGVAACTAQTSMAVAAPDIRDRRTTTTQLLKFISSIDALVAVMVLGGVFLLRPLVTDRSFSLLGQWANVGAVVLLCLGLLFLFGLFLSSRMGRNEMVLVVIAIVVMTSGGAALLNFSPLLANIFLGIFLVNLARNKEQIFNLLVGIEKPIYLLVLIFLGVNWRLDSFWVVLLALGYGFFRGAGKLAGGFAIRLLGKDFRPYPRLLGLGLLNPGGLAFAILLDFYQVFTDVFVSGILSIVLLGFVVTDIISPYALGSIIRSDPFQGH